MIAMYITPMLKLNMTVLHSYCYFCILMFLNKLRAEKYI